MLIKLNDSKKTFGPSNRVPRQNTTTIMAPATLSNQKTSNEIKAAAVTNNQQQQQQQQQSEADHRSGNKLNHHHHNHHHRNHTNRQKTPVSNSTSQPLPSATSDLNTSSSNERSNSPPAMFDYSTENMKTIMTMRKTNFNDKTLSVIGSILDVPLPSENDAFSEYSTFVNNIFSK
jgi:hypothetical protein